MPANEVLLTRLRELMEDVPNVEEKKMFNGVTFMVDDKMCIGVSNDNLMCRIGPEAHDGAVEQPGVREMRMKDKVYRGYVYVDSDAVKSKAQMQRWVDACLAFNPLAESSKKKKPGGKSDRAKS